MWKKCPRLNKNQIKELGNVINNSQSSGKEVRRAQAIWLLNKEEDVAVISSITSYSRRQAFDLRKNYLKKALKASKTNEQRKPKNF